MKRWLYILCMIAGVFTSVCLHAQYNLPENKVWVFDANNGIDFNTTPPTTFASSIGGNPANRLPGTYPSPYPPGAAVSDNTGKLLFYTDGSVVWDRNGTKMPNANTLGAALSVAPATGGADGALIAGIPGSAGKYYVFSLCDWKHSYPSPGRLFYSVIDMQLNSGLGDAVKDQRWMLIDTGLSQKMTAVRGNNCNIWLIAHTKETNIFKVYEVTWKGINKKPVVSVTGLRIQGLGEWYNGQLTISPDGTKLVASYGSATESVAELYDFDLATGKVSNGWVIDSSMNGGSDIWGATFSPDNSKLYTTHGCFPSSCALADAAIYQFDISLPTHQAIKFSENIVAGVSYAQHSAQATAWELRLAPDGKIYFAASTGTPMSFGTIEFPNIYGAGCAANMVANYVPASTFYSGFGDGLGNEPVFATTYLHPDTFAITKLDTCLSTEIPIHVVLSIPQGDFLQYTWNQGSDSTAFVATKPGTYWVTCIDRCQNVTIDSFIIKSLPVFSLPADTAVCVPPNSLVIKANVAEVAYLWSDNNTSDSIIATTSGTYRLQVTREGCNYTDSMQVQFIDLHQSIGPDTTFCREDMKPVMFNAQVPTGASALWNNGNTASSITVTDTGMYSVIVSQLQCQGSDTAYLQAEKCDCHFGMPSAFTPNGDGKNDVFRAVLESNCQVTNYVINVYNRWGEKVYTGTDPKTGWDGIYNGQLAALDTYMYTVEFTTEIQKHYQQGDVTLVR